MLFFPKIALFHINCHFIGKVSPMYSFLAGFSSPESIFAEKYLFSVFITKAKSAWSPVLGSLRYEKAQIIHVLSVTKET